MRRKLSYVFFLLLVIFVSLEIILRIYYPFERKIRGNRWEMATNTTYHFENDFNPRLDRQITNHRNSLGFRGEDPPASFDSLLSLLAVGGSTTACTFLTEGKAWPDLLKRNLSLNFKNVWVNNAGIDGHSSFGHLNFLAYYLNELPEKPKIALFLVGANDVDRQDLHGFDSTLNHGIWYRIKKWLENHCETISFARDLKSKWWPQKVFTDRQNWNFTHFREVHLPAAYMDSAIKAQDRLLPAYHDRLIGLIDWCRQHQIEPVLVTQPSVMGDGSKDEPTPRVDFHPFKSSENGRLFWLKLQRYNALTLSVAQDNAVKAIDLATAMPKDTTYYYDLIHFTNAGAEKVAEIIADSLRNHLEEKYPSDVR